MKKQLLLSVAILVAQAADARTSWTPPIGIPAPGFGIVESHEQYQGKSGYSDSGHGPYTVYVDNQSANCDDDNKGTANAPRCSFPTHLPNAGTVVEIHGGPYDFSDKMFTVNADGTAEQPVFFRGVDDGNGLPLIYDADKASFQGRYLIVEDLRFERTVVRTSDGEQAPYGREKIAFRNLEVFNHPRKNGTQLSGQDIVFFRNHVHHNQGDDRHGTGVSRRAKNIWILENHYHHNGGDAVQFCHGCRKAPPENIYIGRNEMHGDRENGVDLKWGANIVVSENLIYGYRPSQPDKEWCYDDGSRCDTYSSGSDGTGIIIGSDGAPVNPWILFNEIYGNSNGIRVEKVAGAWIIGNVIHNNSRHGIQLDKNGDPLHIIGNTIYGANIGISQDWRENFKLNIQNNIFAEMKKAAIDIESHRVAKNSTMHNNLFWNSNGDGGVLWGKNTRAIQSARGIDSAGRGAGNLVAEPLFAAPEAADFRLLPGSPGAGGGRAGTTQSAEEFQAIFGTDLNILVDKNGDPRRDSADIGAFNATTRESASNHD